SLGSIARTLTTPALSGLMLPRERLGAIASSLGLPLGFAERRQMLISMFRAAAELDRLPALLGALQAEVERWDRQYLEWSNEYPATAPIWSDWRSLLACTRSLLNGMIEDSKDYEAPSER